MIIFFIHRFNDVDHIVPVVYRIAKDTSEKITILCLNPNLEIADDFRLKFLREKYNITVDYIYTYYNASMWQKFLGYILCGPQKNPFANFFRKLLFKLDYDKIIKQAFGQRWAKGLLKYTEASVLIFDHALTPKLWIAASLLSAAKSSNTSIIIIPHGVNLFSEYPPDVFAKAFLNLKNLDVDYIIVPHKRYSHELLNNGVNSEKVIALGSARYCREWNGVLQRIVPSGNLPDTKKLKVVYMERGADRHGKYKDTIRETIEKISQLEFIHFIFKPQPRSNNLFLNIHCPIEIANDVNSVSLIRWADVVIATISSIILEILEQRKVFLYPRFFHEYRMLFDEMDACWAVNNYQELEGALRKLAREPGYKPYPDENADSFLNEVVYDSQGNSDVLGDYEKVILNSAKRAR